MAHVSGGKGLDEALRRIGDKLKSAQVRVGFLETANHSYSEGINIPTVAALNNFGAPGAGIPPRPFFSNMVRDQSPTWAQEFLKALQSSEFDVEIALKRMGLGIEGQLIEAITSLTEPPNSPVTNLLKQRFPMGEGVTFADVQQAREDVANGVSAPPGKPLNWSGVMRNSIGSEVEDL